jgi:ABC-type lipoprotein export system ATPase subunit
MLALKNISKSFIQRGLVLDNLALNVSEGDSIAIMGPSGSGKTTFMNIIGLLDKPDTGEIFFRGAPILTVKENILLPLLASKHTKDDLAFKEKHVTKLMQKSGISNLSAKYPFRISGGEAQRVALVRALANNPSILLADEPTGSLDANNADIMGKLLLNMNREFGITLILATHSAKLAEKMSRILLLDEGKLVVRS